MAFFLRDIFDEKLKRDKADADQFRNVVQYEFASGLNATVEGAASAMRRWVKSRPAWVSEVQHARRLATLMAIEAAISGRTPKARPSSETLAGEKNPILAKASSETVGKGRLPVRTNVQSGYDGQRSRFAGYQSE